jgi:hypothetical protein
MLVVLITADAARLAAVRALVLLWSRGRWGGH